MHQIELSQARLNLTDVLSEALKGEEIVFTENSHPVLRLTRIVESQQQRTLGTAQGQVWMSPDFNNVGADFTAPTTDPVVSKVTAQAKASLFLSDHLPDRISASTPALDGASQTWHVPVILAYPQLGVLGQVGEIVVSATEAEILAHTPVEKMRKTAGELIEQQRDAIEAPLS
jgi:antitoxin (DNA-binding transcriptional repressor) of toxin-antitoxin stability system